MALMDEQIVAYCPVQGVSQNFRLDDQLSTPSVQKAYISVSSKGQEEIPWSGFSSGFQSTHSQDTCFIFSYSGSFTGSGKGSANAAGGGSGTYGATSCSQKVEGLGEQEYRRGPSSSSLTEVVSHKELSFSLGRI